MAEVIIKILLAVIDKVFKELDNRFEVDKLIVHIKRKK